MTMRIHILPVIAGVVLTACSADGVRPQLFPADGAEDVNPDTRLVLNFNSVPVVGDSGFVRVYDVETGLVVDSLDLSIPAGPTEPRKYGPDCDYTKVPYDYSRTKVPTNRDTRPGLPSGTAIADTSQWQLTIIGGFTDGFHFHPILVRDSTATIYLHNNTLLPGKSYLVEIDPGVISVADGSFGGLTDWQFSTRGELAAIPDTIRVSADGSGDFNTVQGALDFIPDFSTRSYVVSVAPGDYEEIVYARNKTNVTIIGSGPDETRVHYANNEVFNPHPLNVKTNEWPGTFPSRRAAFALDNCSDIVIRDITIATDLKGQAEGLLLMGDRIALYNVHIIGSGDALQANGTIYMEGCSLDGGGDTLLGRGSLFAYRCDFRNDGGPFTWVRNTAGNHGDIFVECTFSTNGDRQADFGRTKTNHGTGYPDAEMVLIDCRTSNIRPEGWSTIGFPTARMLEYNTVDMATGKPVDVSQRHPYSRRITDPATVEYYRNPENILKGWKVK